MSQSNVMTRRDNTDFEENISRSPTGNKALNKQIFHIEQDSRAGYFFGIIM